MTRSGGAINGDHDLCGAKSKTKIRTTEVYGVIGPFAITIHGSRKMRAKCDGAWTMEVCEHE